MVLLPVPPFRLATAAIFATTPPATGSLYRTAALHERHEARCRCDLLRHSVRSSTALARIQDVPERIAQQIGAEHHEADGQPRQHHQPWRSPGGIRPTTRHAAAP